MSAEKVVLSWAGVEALAQRVALAAKAFQPTAILAITRGGLVPATMIGHHLNLRRIETICASSYGESHQQEGLSLGTPPTFAATDRVLIVDDLIDTGHTLAAVAALYPDAKTAVLLNKHRTQTADFTGERARADAWVVFPWEPKA